MPMVPRHRMDDCACETKGDRRRGANQMLSSGKLHPGKASGEEVYQLWEIRKWAEVITSVMLQSFIRMMK